MEMLEEENEKSRLRQERTEAMLEELKKLVTGKADGRKSSEENRQKEFEENYRKKEKELTECRQALYEKEQLLWSVKKQYEELLITTEKIQTEGKRWRTKYLQLKKAQNE